MPEQHAFHSATLRGGDFGTIGLDRRRRVKEIRFEVARWHIADSLSELDARPLLEAKQTCAATLPSGQWRQVFVT
jgi:hypothetical protein